MVTLIGLIGCVHRDRERNLRLRELLNLCLQQMTVMSLSIYQAGTAMQLLINLLYKGGGYTATRVFIKL